MCLSKKIDYKKLQELAKKYKINEKILAINILGITESQYYNIKYKKSNMAIIFKNKEEIMSFEEKDTLRNKILVQERLTFGSRINYKQLCDISDKYNILITDLIEMFGITKNSCNFIKTNQYHTIIKNKVIENKIKVLMELLPLNRYYSEIEIQNICNQNDITINDFFNYTTAKSKYFDRESYINALSKNKRVWLGDNHALSENFVNDFTLN